MGSIWEYGDGCTILWVNERGLGIELFALVSNFRHPLSLHPAELLSALPLLCTLPIYCLPARALPALAVALPAHDQLLPAHDQLLP